MDLTQDSKDLTNAVLLVIDWLTDNNVHTLAKLLEWNAADLIETYTDRPVEYNDHLMLKGYKAAQLAIEGTMTHNKPHLGLMTDYELERYRKLVDTQIVRCAEKDLTHWADEQAAITTERLGRQAIQALRNLPYNLTRH